MDVISPVVAGIATTNPEGQASGSGLPFCRQHVRSPRGPQGHGDRTTHTALYLTYYKLAVDSANVTEAF